MSWLLVLGILCVITFISKDEPGDSIAAFLKGVSWPLIIVVGFFVLKRQIVDLLDKVVQILEPDIIRAILDIYRGPEAQKGKAVDSSSFRTGSIAVGGLK